MGRGFSDQSGRFHPLGKNNSRKSSRDKSIEPDGVRRSKLVRGEGEFKVFGDFPQFTNEELKEHALILVEISVDDRSELRERQLAVEALGNLQKELEDRNEFG